VAPDRNQTARRIVGSGRSRKPARSSELQSEEDIYQQLGMQYVPPELREDQGEIEAALAGKLPEDLVTLEDIRGMVHCHTTYSDGKHSIEEMARAAQAIGNEVHDDHRSLPHGFFMPAA